MPLDPLSTEELMTRFAILEVAVATLAKHAGIADLLIPALEDLEQRLMGETGLPEAKRYLVEVLLALK